MNETSFLNQHNTHSDFSEKFTKGYLYKIKNNEGKTQGYLFGTIHKLDLDSLLNLHPKIFKALERCKSLFVEINHLDPLSLTSEIKKNLLLINLEESEIFKIVNSTRLEVFSNPNAVEDSLIKYANENEMEVNSLETIDSRIIAKRKISDDIKEIEVKKLAISAFAIKDASDKLVALANSKENNADTQLTDAYEALISAIKRIDFKTDYDEYTKKRLEMKSALSKLIDTYEYIFTRILEEEGKELMITARILYKTLQEFNQGSSPIFEKWLQRVQEAYKKGDKDTRIEFPTTGNLVDKKIKEIRNTELFFRDIFMHQRIQESLEKSRGVYRNFYAVGCAHLLDNYENLFKMLEKSGWKIISAYKID